MKSLIWSRILSAVVAGSCLLLGACYTPIKHSDAGTNRVTQSLANINKDEAKNVILFIGDGMGVSTVTAIRILDGQMKGMSGEENILSWEKFPNVALSKTYETNLQVAESAGTATAIMSGQKTKAGFVGIGPGANPGDCKAAKDHMPPSTLELAEGKGMSTGVISTARLTHATPAAAYAHVTERGWESDIKLSDEAKQEGCSDIAAQLLDFSYGNGIEVAMGGGRLNFFPAGSVDPEGADTEEGRQDNRNLTQEWLNKYPNSAYVWNQEEFDAIDPAKTDHLLGLFNSNHMQYEADRADDVAGEPSLAEMTRKAIKILQRNPKGYFLLVEGARIDHGHHDGNAYQALHDGVAMADAVAVADEMTDVDDTLIVVTADHSHPFTMGGYTARGNPILGKVITVDSAGVTKTEYDLSTDGKPYTVLAYQTGKGAAWVEEEIPRPDLTEVDTEDKGYRQQALIPKKAGAHGGEDVAVYARGPGSSGIHGVIEQNEIFHVIVAAAGLKSGEKQ